VTVVWSPRAIRHLTDLRAYIARDNPDAAARIAETLLTSVERLAGLPNLAARGASPPAFDRRCIPPGCVARRSHIGHILASRALPAGRITGLGATTHLHHGPLGRPGRVSGTRELVVPGTPYVIPYRLQGQRIEIIAVFHGRQRWPQRL